MRNFAGDSSPYFKLALDSYLDNSDPIAETRVVFLRVGTYVAVNDHHLESTLFESNVLRYTTAGGSALTFDITKNVVTAATYNIILLVIVIFLLGVGNLLVVRDAQKLIIGPVERVLDTLKKLATSSSMMRAPSIPRVTRRLPSRASSVSFKARDGSEITSGLTALNLRSSNNSNITSSASASGSSTNNKNINNNNDDTIMEGISDFDTTTMDDSASDEADHIFEMLDMVSSNLREMTQRSDTLLRLSKNLFARLDDVSSEKALMAAKLAAAMEDSQQRKSAKTATAAAGNDQAGPSSSSSSSSSPFSLFNEDDIEMNGLKDVITKTLTVMRDASLDRSRNMNATDMKVVKVDGKTSVLQAASLLRLIERITHHNDRFDAETARVFLLNFRSVLTPYQLFQHIYARYCITPGMAFNPASVTVLTESSVLSIPRLSALRKSYDPSGIFDADANEETKRLLCDDEETRSVQWRVDVQIPVREHVIQFIELWMDVCFFDFINDPRLVRDVKAFLVDSHFIRDTFNHGGVLKDLEVDDLLLGDVRTFPGQSKEIVLAAIIHAKTAQHGDALRKGRLVNYIPLTPSTPATIIPNPEINMNVFERWDVSEVAQQFTLFEFKLFQHVGPNEFFNQCWVKKTKETSSPNLLRWIDHFNLVSGWVKSSIVQCANLKQRIALMKNMISLADHLVRLNNFSGAMEVLAGLSNSAVSRLKHTHEGLSNSSRTSLEELNTLFSTQGSSRVYRERLSKAPLPRIPYVGLYLTDLTFIDEGNSDKTEGELLNVEKYRLTCRVISEIMSHQRVNYNFSPKEEFVQFIHNIQVLDDSAGYKLSLEIEPREPKPSSS
eukprot:TRINITY_DN6209_c0_g1_i6.p1 TRINITY_DN6209_c0_g1~~TRINITY_DN6209_c0_g1_i6.p1  ORF type:complete len:839 (+),score=192.80 TRINITY_DN6209_c0_g1_i6:1055-3571(+)